MKLVSRKILALVAGFATVPAVLVTSGIANADPNGAPTYRAYAGVGSDTTEEVVQSLSDAIVVGGVKVMGSYSARGGAFNSKDPAVNPACSYDAYDATANAGAGNNGPGVRANGSGAGRDRLFESMTAGDPRYGCLDFARSSSGAVKAGQKAIPFATDTLTYAVRGDSTISKKLSLATLKSVYQCLAPAASFTPLLPQAGSGTRSSWLTLLGLTESTKGSCVRDTFGSPAADVQEHNGAALLAKTDIMPYSASQWAAQAIGAIADVRAAAVLGGIDGVPALSSNAAGTGKRTVYNLVELARVTPGDPKFDQGLSDLFVGPTSLVCAQSSVIGKQGFGLLGAGCGSLS